MGRYRNSKQRKEEVTNIVASVMTRIKQDSTILIIIIMIKRLSSMSQRPSITWGETFAFPSWIFGIKILIRESKMRINKGSKSQKNRPNLTGSERNRQESKRNKRGLFNLSKRSAMRVGTKEMFFNGRIPLTKLKKQVSPTNSFKDQGAQRRVLGHSRTKVR